MESNIVILIFMLIMIPVFISTMFIPYWTRRTESFGVSIPEEVYPLVELKSMRKKYLSLIGGLSIVTITIFLLLNEFFVHNENTFSLTFSIIIVLYIIGSFIIYLTFHKKMKALKLKNEWGREKSKQVMINTSFRSQKLTHTNFWFIIPFLVSIITIVFTLQFYERIPERIPMNYNFAGEVTNWADRSYRTVIVMPVMQVYMTLLFLFINTMIAKSKQQISVERPEESQKQLITFRKRWSAFIIITGTALVLLFTFIQLSIIFPINQWVMMIVPLIFTVGVLVSTIILSFTTGQGGSRLKTSTGSSGEVIDRDDDQYWKLGQFYYNRNDPALFLEKRFGIGWTINIARPLAWIIFLIIILLAVGIPLVLGV